MGLSASKRVSGTLNRSSEFTTACDAAFEESLTLAQHASTVVHPYQLLAAAVRLHRSLIAGGVSPLVRTWVPDPPSRSQVDKAYRSVVSRRRSPQSEESSGVGKEEFKSLAVEVFTDAVISNAGNALIRRVPIGVAGIAGIGMATRSGKDLVGTAIGVYALGVVGSIYLSLIG
ncbi:uncharacterized protein LOC124939851 [Impatiens glandulifera]|uniref:uncharacterized protein LOC124939851 n=1 Tax=Impatiens glandulifera TaxID=253017 RepID=UPI001FB1148C|nr:uncharacterized protein LOC124939851 [Impatiens glandulifera]